MRAEHHRPGFGGAVGVGHGRLRQRRVDRLHQALAHRRRAHADELDAGEIGARQQIALAQHHGDHRRHRGEPGGAIAADRLDIGGRVELRQQHDGGVRRAGELRQRERVHVIERRRDQIAVAVESGLRAGSPPPRGGSGARARRPSACRSSPRCRETSPARAAPARRRRTDRDRGSASKLSAPSPPKQTTGRPGGQSARRAASQNTSFAPASLRMKWMVCARELEVHRHRDQAGAHDAEIGGEIFGAIGGEDATRSPRASPRLSERARDAVRHGVELRVGEFARGCLAAEIDDRDLAQVAVAADQVAEIGEGGHDISLVIPGRAKRRVR